VIRLEGGAPGRVRVIGSLDGHGMRQLFGAISRGAVVLDLSGVDQSNESALMFLARLPKERCEVAECPGWLSVWLERFRRSAGPGR
jgi:hypothetical protein